MAFFLEIDFENHVALVSEIDEGGHPVIVAGGRYAVIRPGRNRFCRDRWLSSPGDRDDSHETSGCTGAGRRPQGADRGNGEYRHAEGVQEVRLLARPAARP